MQPETSDLRVLVLAGGSSTEREVSLESGQCVTEALQSVGIDPQQLDPAVTPVRELRSTNWDVSFPVVHGTKGEDGILQQHLVDIGLPYVGSSPEASALTFDKQATRNRMIQNNIRVAHAVAVRKEDNLADFLRDLEADWRPVVAKPSRQGSSVGVTIVHDPDQLESAVTSALNYDNVCLIEDFIDGRELTVAVVDGTALPTVEITVADDWYDYQAKYSDDRTRYTIRPAGIPDDIGEVAAMACKACGVTGIARVDFRLDSSGVLWLLEVNSVPGMTSHSLVPKAASAIGLSLGELCLQAIQNRLKRAANDDRAAMKESLR